MMNIFKKYLSLFLILLFFLLTSCEDLVRLIDKPSIKNKDNIVQKEIRPLDKLFINGFKIKLEQIYIMSKDNTDDYVDICFEDGTEIINLPNFQKTNYDNNLIMTNLTQNMIWEISKMIKIPYNYTIEHGYNSNYFLIEVNDTITHNNIKVHDSINLRVSYIVGDIYTYRHSDNHNLVIKILNSNGSIEYTNLVLEIVKEFDGKYLYLQTNNQYNLSVSITQPLTGDRVKYIVDNGTLNVDYEIYLWNGLNTIKIGNNLYIPRYNSYVYIGTINSNGMINGYTKLYYRLKFRII